MTIETKAVRPSEFRFFPVPKPVIKKTIREMLDDGDKIVKTARAEMKLRQPVIKSLLDHLGRFGPSEDEQIDEYNSFFDGAVTAERLLLNQVYFHGIEPIKIPPIIEEIVNNSLYEEAQENGGHSIKTPYFQILEDKIKEVQPDLFYVLKALCSLESYDEQRMYGAMITAYAFISYDEAIKQGQIPERVFSDNYVLVVNRLAEDLGHPISAKDFIANVNYFTSFSGNFDQLVGEYAKARVINRRSAYLKTDSPKISDSKFMEFARKQGISYYGELTTTAEANIIITLAFLQEKGKSANALKLMKALGLGQIDGQFVLLERDETTAQKVLMIARFLDPSFKEKVLQDPESFKNNYPKLADFINNIIAEEGDADSI
ncbi:hypothetical protein A3F29_04055 [Candidatus Roizmanbacteria bacterium RIFCSPHIGHO2_12_FULL_33_9]|uniref:Uncharacterized protein n=1 Tax=Candidatus Roizmanbacteria bacterium RIFCSPHIGHO2_12_FULL_33_9 TaxID=1802045 RepID=A0A1F7HK68_9BACT|nr:MAG: hypothetical protein A3F29_04055 [Candidatus Roizmanbacteria bacterium RIFCSPHIGHO2_12_FULL_33_9]